MDSGSRCRDPAWLQALRLFPFSPVAGRRPPLAARHAGGRGFESRRSRPLYKPFAASRGEWDGASKLLMEADAAGP